MPDESWETRQIEGLLRSFVDLSRELGAYETRLAGLDREFRQVHATRRDDMSATTTAMKDLEEEWDERIGEIYKEFKDFRKEIQDTEKAVKKEAIENRRNIELTRFQSFGLFIAACSLFINSIFLVIPYLG